MKRLWGIRHIRYFILARRLEQWRRAWGCLWAAESDIEYLEAVWNGTDREARK